MTTRCRRICLFALAALPTFAAPLASAQTPDAEMVKRRESFTDPLRRSALRERAIAMLLEGARADNAMLRANSIEGLQTVPSRVEPLARAALTDPNLGVRFTAAMTIGKLGLCDSSALVRPLLTDQEPIVQAGAICALRRCNAEVDPTPLANLLFSSDPKTRAIGAFVLGELGDPSAIPMLKSAANRGSVGGLPVEQKLFQLQVAEALGKLGDAEALQAVRAALYPGADEEYEAAVLAAQILGELKDRSAVRELVTRIEEREGREFTTPPELRLASAAALAKMGYRDGAYVAQQLWQSESSALRAQSAFVFGETVGEEGLEFLETMLDDADPLVQVAAATAIVKVVDRLAKGR